MISLLELSSGSQDGSSLSLRLSHIAIGSSNGLNRLTIRGGQLHSLGLQELLELLILLWREAFKNLIHIASLSGQQVQGLREARELIDLVQRTLDHVHKDLQLELNV